MATNRYISTKIYNDAWFMELSAEKKLLFIYLFTNQLCNISGVYEITKKRMSFDTGIGYDRLSKALKDFQKDGKIVYFEEISYIVMVNFIKHQSLNPKILTGIDAIVEKLPEKVKSILFKDIEVDENSKHIGYDRLSKATIYLNLNLNSNINFNINFNQSTETLQSAVSIETKKISIEDDKPKKPTDKIPSFEEFLEYGKKYAVERYSEEFPVCLIKLKDTIESCHDYWEEKNWMRGKEPVKDWQKTLQSWLRKSSTSLTDWAKKNELDKQKAERSATVKLGFDGEGKK